MIKQILLSSLPSREDKKIVLLSCAILFCIALIGMLSGFLVFSSQSKLLLKENLQQVLESNVNFFEDDISHAFYEVNAILHNPFFQRAVQHPQNNILKDLNALFLAQGFSAVQLSDAAGKSLYASGKFSRPAHAVASLNLPYRATLFWQNGWAVRLIADIRHTGKKVGVLSVEWPLANANRAYAKNAVLGQSGDLMVCARSALHQALCFPHALHEKPFLISLSAEGQYGPMHGALAGKSGEQTVLNDENKKVITVYSPIGSFGLGAVAKIDTTELYQPIRQQLLIIIPIFLFSIGVGLFLLYWRVSPLVRKLIVSEKKALDSHRRLTDSEQHFRTAFDFAAVGMALVSLDGFWLRVNQSLCQVLGFDESDFLKMDFQKITYLDDLPQDTSQLADLVDGKINNVCAQKRFFTKKGEIIWTMVNYSLVRDANQSPLYFVFQIQDINTQKHTEENLKQMAYHDPLTGLDNRSQIEKNIQHALLYSEKNKSHFAIIMLDLDHFKDVNDTYGHDAGDILLKTISERLRNTVRHTDQIGRLGGDEFIILITDFLNPDFVKKIAQKILDYSLDPIVIKGQKIYNTMSVGISIYPSDGTDMQTLMKHADLALYQAKQKGRDNYQFFTDIGVMVSEKP